MSKKAYPHICFKHKKRIFLKNQQNDDCSLKKCLSLQMKSVFPT